MMPVKFFFRGSYSNKNAFWEKWSSPAIMLTNSASKWYEKAFITLALVNIGYDAKLISKPVCFYILRAPIIPDFSNFFFECLRMP